MTYKKILKQLSVKENIPAKEIENEMQKALCSVGVDCSAKEFIEAISFFISKRRYIV